MKMKFEIQYRGVIGMGARDFKNRFLNRMYTAMGLHWFRNMLPKHFERSAVNAYHYGTRDALYMRRKAREKGHQRPLVWSGQLERDTKSQVRVDPARDGARVVLTGARKSNFSNAGMLKHKVFMRKELTEVNESDARELIEVGNAWMARALRRYPQTKIVRIG